MDLSDEAHAAGGGEGVPVDTRTETAGTGLLRALVTGRADGSGEDGHVGPERVAGWERAAVAVGLVLAAVPFLRMASLVRHGTRTQYNDYWFIIDGTLRADGWLDLGGLFMLRNEHSVVVAKLLYWLNARVLGGSNITLGWIVLLMVVAQVVLLGSFLRRVPLISRAAMAVALSALLFAPQGSWSFMKAMSGTAWLSASLLAIAAIWLRSRDHRLPAIAAAVLAALSYATGLLAWPALLATGLARDRKPKAEWPVVVAAAISGALYLERYRHIDHVETLDNTSQLPLRHAGTIVGSIFAPGEGNLTRTLGWAIMAAGVVLTVLALRADARRAAPWTGLFTFAIGSVGLIAVGRNTFLGDFGTSRYSSLAALVCASVLGQAVLVLRWKALHVAVCLAMAIAASTAGGKVVEDLRNTKPEQELLAITLRLDLADGSTRWLSFGQQFPDVTPVLAGIGHYPFGGRFSADCGLLGERLPDRASGPRAPQRLGDGVGDVAPAAPLKGVPGAVEILGRLDDPARCVLVADRSRRVVGVGLIGYQRSLGPRSPSDVFTAVAPTGLDDYLVYAVPRR